MALIECPDCRRRVSDAAAVCPHCGRPIARQPQFGQRRVPPAGAAKPATVTATVMKGALTIWFWLTVLLITVGVMEGRFPGPINNWLLPIWMGMTAFVFLSGIALLLLRGKRPRPPVTPPAD